MEGVLAYRINTGAVKVGARLVRFGVVGFSDLIAFPWFNGESHPRTLFVEVKRPKGGRQTPEQRSFAQQVEEHGMHYLLARGVDDVERWLVDSNRKRAATP